MKIAVTGHLGMLGSDLFEILNRNEFDVSGLDLDTIDLSDFRLTREVISEIQPEILIHTAAMTGVDDCEKHPEKALLQNGKITENLVEICSYNSIKLIYISTDYVFNGNKSGFYTEEDPVDPINVYGSTKLYGEKSVLKNENNAVIRISWLFGKRRGNFVTFINDSINQGKDLKIISDQIGTPTYTIDLARAILHCISSGGKLKGIFHISNEGECSWFDWAVYIKQITGSKINIEPIPASQFSRPASRPGNSRLSKEKLKRVFGYVMPGWKDATARFLKEKGVDISVG